MNLFKKNPFASVLAALTAALSIAALYYLYTTHSLFVSERDTYGTSTGKLSQLQSARPGPNQENLNATKEELDQARAILERLSATVATEAAPFDASLTPQRFQDALADQVDTLTAQAEKAGVALPDNFALGFERYRTEPPSPAAAPFLGQQLQSIGTVASLLVKAQVKRITSLARAPLRQEGAETAEDAGAQSGENRFADVTLAPFDIAFEADQANFRESINSIMAAKPVVFIRLLDVANSQPKAPSKQDDPTPAESASAVEEETARVPVVFGQESLVVTMRLAAVSADIQSKKN